MLTLFAYNLLLIDFLRSLSLYQIIFIELDNFLISAVIFQTTRQLLLLGHFAVLNQYSNTVMFQALIRYLKQTIEMLKKRKRPNEMILFRQISLFIKAHWQLVLGLIRLDGDFQSKFFFAAFLCNFPVSVCFQTMILTKNLNYGI